MTAALEPVSVARDRSLDGHVSLVASAHREPEGDAFTLAYPAVADGKLSARGPGELVCIDLAADLSD